MATEEPKQPFPDVEDLGMEDPGKAAQDDDSAFQASPKRRCSICCGWWLFLFWALFQFIFGVICIATSASWNHDAGVAFGIVVILLLIVFLLVRRKDLTQAKNRVCGAPDPHIDEGPVGRAVPALKAFAFFFFILTTFVFALICFIMVAIYWQSPDPDWKSFPGSCPGKVNCARVADNSTYGITYGEAPEFNTSLTALMSTAKSWVITEDTKYYERTAILKLTDNFLHARFLTGFWGFADDFAIYAFCTDTNTTEVWIHSESRVSTGGSGNPNINPERIIDFIKYFNLTSTSNTSLPIAPCQTQMSG